MADDDGSGSGQPPPSSSKDERRQRRSRSSKQPEGDGSGGEAAAVDAFLLMENVMDKLKLLDYDSNFCSRFNLKPIHRYYFAISSDPSEQLHYLASLISWLLSLSGQGFPPPDQYDDPNSICANIMHMLKKTGIDGASQSNVRSGSGPEVCQILNDIARTALQASKWQWEKPRYPHEAPDEDEIPDAQDDVVVGAGDGSAALSGGTAADDSGDDEDDVADDIVGGDVDSGDVAGETPMSFDGAGVGAVAVKQNILKANIDAAAWRIEVERVLPELKVQIRADSKDWRTHVEQMNTYQESIKGSLSETHTHLDKLHTEISNTLEKIDSREKYINKQLENIATEYRVKQDALAATVERYKQSSGTVTELTAQLAKLSDDLDQVKAQMDERGSSMTDTGPLVRVKQSLTRLKKDTTQMDLRIGVVQHTLMQAQMHTKNAMVLDMNQLHGIDDSDY